MSKWFHKFPCVHTYYALTHRHAHTCISFFTRENTVFRDFDKIDAHDYGISLAKCAIWSTVQKTERCWQAVQVFDCSKQLQEASFSLVPRFPKQEAAAGNHGHRRVLMHSPFGFGLGPGVVKLKIATSGPNSWFWAQNHGFAPGRSPLNIIGKLTDRIFLGSRVYLALVWSCMVFAGPLNSSLEN